MLTTICRKLLFAAVTTVAMGGATATAFAREPATPGDKVVYKKRTVIDLSGAVIEGELTKPEGSYIVNRKVSRFSSLIKLRENFVPELLASTDML